MKRIISMILTLAMVLSMLPVPASVSAAEAASGSLGENLTWTLTDDGTLTVSGTGAIEDQEDYESAPWEDYEIQSIVIGEGITAIGSYTFDGLYATSLQLPEGLTSIGQGAFEANSFGEIVLPDSVTEIGADAFCDNSSLVSLTLSRNLTTIGEYAFYGADAIAQLTIPASVTYVGTNAFGGCSAELVVTFAGNAPANGSGAEFSACTIRYNVFDKSWTEEAMAALSTTATWESCYPETAAEGTMDSGLAWILYADGTLWVSGEGAMDDYDDLTSRAPWYDHRDGIIRVIVESGVTTVGSYAFDSCTKLTAVTLPEGITAIGSYAFASAALTEIVFPEDVTTIGSYALAQNEGLTELTIPASVTALGEMAFGGCTGLSVVTFCGDAPTFGNDVFNGVTATVRYSLSSDTWTGDVMQTYGGTLAWEGYCPGHVGVLENASDATCEQPGYTGDEVCRYCGEVLATGQEIPTTDHTVVIDAAVAPSCTTTGLTEGSHCSTCGEVLVAQEEVPMVEHAFNYNNRCNVCNLYGNYFGDGLMWTVSSGVLTISGEGAMPDYTSYSSSQPWWANKSNITKIVIEEGVTSIGAYAFYGYSKVTIVTIPASVTSMGSYAFSGCSAMAGVYITDLTSWLSIDFANGTANPLNCAKNLYLNNSKLATVTIPKGVTEIKPYAFYNCTGMTALSFLINDTVTSIGTDAFYGCTGLTKVSVQSMEFWFKIDFADPDANPASHVGCLTEWYSKAKSFAIPASITEIKPYACYNFDLITTVYGCSNVATVGDYAFYGCTALNDVYPMLAVETIGSHAFQNCFSLPSILSSRVLTSIGDSAYRGCTSITTLNLPETVTSVGNYAFYDCSGITTLTIPESVTSIGNCAFYNCTGITALELPSQLESLGDNAFMYCSGLTELTIPGNIKTIGNYAFRSCTGITTLTLAEGVQSVGEYAFANCSALTTVNLPASLKELKSYAFYQDSALTTANISDLAAWCGVSFGNYTSSPGYYTNQLTLNGSAITNLVIPEGVETINGYAFYYCKNITSLALPESLRTIKAQAFGYCTGLTRLTIPAGVTKIGGSAFSNCSALSGVYISDLAAWCAIQFDAYAPGHPLYLAKKLYLNNQLITSLVIPEGVESIGTNAFYGATSITSISIPDSVTSIGQAAFRNCTGITSLTIPAGVTSVPGTMVSGCTNLTEVNLPSGLTAIGSSAFSSCSKLTALEIPETVTSIGSYAFSSCSALASVNIPEGVTLINEYTFQNCGSLTEIAIPDGVTTINNYAFSGCSGLTGIAFPASVETIGSYAFQSNSALTEIQFRGDAPTIATNSFTSVKATAKYPYGNETWTDTARANYGGTLTWQVYTLADTVAEGTCGDNITWTLDADGVLMLSGSGAMNDYPRNTYYYPASATSPWAGNRSAIKKVIVNDGITYIGQDVFYACENLRNITFLGDKPDFHSSALYRISTYGYYKADNSTWDPDTLEQYSAYNIIWKPMGESADYIVYDDSNSRFTWSLDYDGLLTITTSADIPNSTRPWYNYRMHITDLVINGKYTNIGSYVFQNLTKLQTARFEGSVNSLGSYAFWCCESLEEVYFGETLTSISDRVFMDCTKLNTVYLPPSVTSIGDYAFSSCDGLTTVTIPGYVSLGSGVFVYDSNLKTIYINEPSLSGFSAETDAFEGITATILYPRDAYLSNTGNYGGTITWTESDYGTCGHNVRWYYNETTQLLEILGQGGVSTDYDAGGETPWGRIRNSISSITVGSGVTMIPNYIFENCPNLTTVTLPKTLTNLALNAFNNCSSLNNLLLPASLESFKIDGVLYNSLSGVSSMTDLYYEGTREHWAAVDGSSGVTVSGASTSWHFLELQPSTATCTASGLAEYYAFDDTSVYSTKYDANRNVITTLATVPALGHDLGEWVHTQDATCIALAVETKSCSRCDYTETRTVGELGAHAYESVVTAPTCTAQGYTTHTCSVCGDSYVDSYVDAIPHSYEGFICTDCGALADEIGGTCGENVAWTFDPETGVLAFTGSGEMTDFENNASTPWYKLTTRILSVSISDDITAIGSNTFYGCRNLASVELPAALTTIGDKAFYNCKGLTSLVIPGSVTAIGSNAFARCSALTELTFEGSAPAIADDAFTGITASAGYPMYDATWNEATLSGYGGDITWTPNDPCENGHTEETIPGKAATCTETGLTEGKHCSVCGEVLAAQEEIPVLAHNYESVVTEPTCYRRGYTTHTCTVCGYSYADSYVDVIEHNYKTKVFAPTCTSNGYTLYTCMNAVCNSSYTVPIPATGHTEETIPGKAATCTETGLNEGKHCSVCEEVLVAQEEIPALGHNYVDGTCTECGEADPDAVKLFKISFASMTMANSLDMNFAFEKGHVENWSGYYAKIEKEYADGRENVIQIVPFGEWKSTTINKVAHYYVTFTGIAAKEMTDNIYVTIYNGNDEAVSEVWIDSVQAQAMRNLAKSNVTALSRTMVVDMLNYGSAAQSKFGYNSNNLANSLLSDEQKAYATPSVSYTDESVHGSNYRANVLLKSNIQFMMAFSGIDQTMKAVVTFTNHHGVKKTVEIDGTDFTKSGSFYIITIEDTVIADGRQAINCKIYDGETVVAEATDSMASYAARAAQKEGNELYEMIMKFSDSAYAYLHK